MRNRKLAVLLALICAGGSAISQGASAATSLEIQDPSFEQADVSSPTNYGPFFATNIQDPQWNPAWKAVASSPNFVGLFLNPAHYSPTPGPGALTYSAAPAGSPANGHNLGFIAAENGTEIYQGLVDTSGPSPVAQKFTSGAGYTLQVGLAKSFFEPPAGPTANPTATPSIVASLFYIDSSNASHAIAGASTTVSADALSNSNVQFYSASLPAPVTTSDPWWNQQIGIALTVSSLPDSGGNFDFDSFSVVTTPEPASLLVAMAPLALLMRPSRRFSR